MIIKGYNNEEFNIEIGDSVRLRYNGSYEVPLYMSGKIVKVLGFTKKKIKVGNNVSNFNVSYEQVKRIK